MDQALSPSLTEWFNGSLRGLGALLKLNGTFIRKAALDQLVELMSEERP